MNATKVNAGHWKYKGYDIIKSVIRFGRADWQVHKNGEYIINLKNKKGCMVFIEECERQVKEFDPVKDEAEFQELQDGLHKIGIEHAKEVQWNHGIEWNR